MLLGWGAGLFTQYGMSCVIAQRRAADHSGTVGRLSQFRSGVNQYHEIYGRSPIPLLAGDDHENDNWRTRLLMYLEDQKDSSLPIVFPETSPLWFTDPSDSGNPTWTSFVLITFNDAEQDEFANSERWAIVRLPHSGISWLSSDAAAFAELSKRIALPCPEKRYEFLASDGTIGVLSSDGIFFAGDPIQLLATWTQKREIVFSDKQ